MNLKAVKIHKNEWEIKRRFKMDRSQKNGWEIKRRFKMDES